MGHCIIHHQGVFNVWSTVVDAAIEDPMTGAEVRNLLAKETTVFEAAIESIDSRIARAKARGTTMRGHESLADTVRLNRMGPREGRVSIKEVIRLALTLPEADEIVLCPDDDDIDCSGTDEIVCPHCGYENDPTDFFDGIGASNSRDWDCTKCGKTFTVTADFTTTYTSEKKEAPDAS